MGPLMFITGSVLALLRVCCCFLETDLDSVKMMEAETEVNEDTEDVKDISFIHEGTVTEDINP